MHINHIVHPPAILIVAAQAVEPVGPAVRVEVAPGTSTRRITLNGSTIVVAAQTHGGGMPALQGKTGFLFMVKPKVFAQHAPVFGGVAKTTVFWELFVRDDGTPFFAVPADPFIGRARVKGEPYGDHR